MTTIDRIREICKERNIPISRLEKACGFSNGYINSLSKGVMPFDRLYKVAVFLNVSSEYLAFGQYDELEQHIKELNLVLEDIGKELGAADVARLCAYYESHAKGFLAGALKGRKQAREDARETFKDIPEIMGLLDDSEDTDA